MLYVKSRTALGCVFLGKGIVGHPEMGVVEDACLVVFDEWDFPNQCWAEKDRDEDVYYTTNGFVFTGSQLRDGTFAIEEYAPNRLVLGKPDVWGR